MSQENKIENNLIRRLKELKYIYRPDIRDRKTLEDNFKAKFEALHRVELSDKEFLRLRQEIIESDVFKASKFLRQKQVFQRDDGTILHYTLINNKDWCKNDFEVVSQVRINTENSYQRYDVIILINGLPLVQIELKRQDISPRRAMQQISDYKSEQGNGYGNSLLCFVQMFIVSNQNNTFYFANNKKEHFSFHADEQFLPIYQFADQRNKKITQLDTFAEKFLSKCTLAEMLSKYMVLVESEQKLLMMRPYQIYAVKAIVDCIEQNRGNGYIWHTTGSGKTLTSFKAATLLKDNSNIEKCLFVVDRKDLDRQTREEFNKFQEGSVEENTNTETLVRRLLSDNYADKIIVTTIQKLGLALDATRKTNYKERLKPLSQKRVVFIFDECHRSQFGENHDAIKDFFPNAQLFGFTGTPIFKDNAIYTQIEGEEKSHKTTEDIFKKRLHAYTITHAIEDKNVLKFHIDYFTGKGGEKLNKGESLAKKGIVEAILEKHDKATDARRFNAIFATASINDAIEYYELFASLQKQKQAQDPKYQPLNVGCVFSPPAEGNKDSQQMQEDLLQEKEDNKYNPEEKKKALERIIHDYNLQYGSNHTLTEFDLYYQDLQKRIKDQKYNNQDYPHQYKIDLVIVVDMLLTGFDSKYLNTLYVDKNLKYHGLIQAFSRTNRVLNDTKPQGNILDFRSQKDAVNRAITLFSGEGNAQAKEIWFVESAPLVIDKYKEAVEELEKFMQTHQLGLEPQQVYHLKGDSSKATFARKFKEVQRLKTQLDQYTDTTEKDQKRIENILPKESLQGFKAAYLEIARDFRKKEKQEGTKPSDEVQELDFELVLFASAVIDYDYIIKLVAENSQQTVTKEKMTPEQIIALLRSNANFMDSEALLADYIRSLPSEKGYTVEELKNGFEVFKAQKYNRQIEEIAKKHNLQPIDLQAFVEGIMVRMIFDGQNLTTLLKPLNLTWQTRAAKELELMADLIPLLQELANGKEISGLKAYC